MEQHTYELETTDGLVYMVIDDGQSVEEQFDLYKEDESWCGNPNAEIISVLKLN